ncbi:MAG: mucoidy inhibitor MuiA family protein [Deltaproteobacteria bacterium]|nr:mucoidy inhibitor MuiA family protein [Deltaproteobacteria bacterium]
MNDPGPQPKINALSLFLALFVGGLLALAPAVAEALPPSVKAAAPGKIVSAVVYRDRAQVTRRGIGNCAKGIAEFGALPSTLDPKTLRANLVGGGEVIGVTFKTEVTGPRGEAKALVTKRRELLRKLRNLAADRAAAQVTGRKLLGFAGHMRRVWGYQAAGKKVPIGTWDAALALLHGEGLAVAKRLRVVAIASRKIRRELREVNRQLAQIRRMQRRETYRATVLLRGCQGRPKVDLAYVVPGATWRIAYQARVDTRAKRVSLVAQAIVQQATGENWKGVQLAVSTANLQRSNLPPTIRTMHVSTRKPYSKQKVLARRFERRRHLKTKTVAPKAKNQARRGAPDSGLALRLVAAGHVDVPSDGRGIAVVLSKVSRRAAYAYETVPKLFPFVYHRVRLANPFPFPMLPGPISIYRDGGFTAKTTTKLRAPGEPITLSLGIDNQLQVKRWVKEVKRYKAGTFSATQTLKHRYLVEVGNWTGRRRTILVKENVPVSQNKDIKVVLDSKATKPTSWNRADGIVTYRLVVPPRSKRQITVAYTISLPKSYKVNGYVSN